MQMGRGRDNHEGSRKQRTELKMLVGFRLWPVRFSVAMHECRTPNF